MPTDTTAEMLKQVGAELAGQGISMETLLGQARGDIEMGAPDGLTKLATVYEAQYALWFFEFLKGYVQSPAESPAEIPDIKSLGPTLTAALAGLPLSDAEKAEIVKSLLEPLEAAGSPAAEAGADAGNPEDALNNLQKQVEEMQAQLDKQLAELKAQAAEVPGAEAPMPEAAAPEAAGEAPKAEADMPTQEQVGALEKAIEDLQASIDKAVNGIQPPQGV